MTGSGQDSGADGGAQDTSTDDAVWQTALDWVMRQHEQPLDAGGVADLRTWLDAAAAHRQAYDQALQVWRLTGRQPSSAGD